MSNELSAIPSELSVTIEEWARWTIWALQGSIAKYKIKGSGALMKSFTYKLSYGADGMPKRVTIGFYQYGKFIDMGVGKGVKIGDVKGNAEVWRALSSGERKGQKTRKPKKWYSPTMYYEYQRMAELLVEKYKIEIPARFEYTMAERIQMNLD